MTPLINSMKITPLLFLLGSSAITSAATIFADDFNRADGAVGNGWVTEYLNASGGTDGTISNGSAVIQNNSFRQVVPSNGDAGIISTSRTVSSSGAYSTILSNSGGRVSWGIRVTDVEHNPSNNFLPAFIIGATSSSFVTEGSGYMVTINGTNNDDAVVFARYDGGLGPVSGNVWSNSTDLLAAAAGTGAFGAAFSVRVDYMPATDLWEFYVGAGGADPFSLGSGDLAGSVNDSTFTASDLSSIGLVFRHTNNPNAPRFVEWDDLSLSAVPEPSAAALGAIALLGCGLRRRR